MPRIILLSTCLGLLANCTLGDEAYSTSGTARSPHPRLAARPTNPIAEVGPHTSNFSGRHQGRSSPSTMPTAAQPHVVSVQPTSPPRTGGGPIPIPPPKPNQATDRDSEPESSLFGGLAAVVTSSLAIVIGLFLLVVWFARRAMPRASLPLPSEVLEVLGKSPLTSRHHLQLIRLGRKLVLISACSDGAETLSEIDEPGEVERLVGLCQQNRPGSVSTSFRQILDQLGTQKADAEVTVESSPRANYRSR